MNKKFRKKCFFSQISVFLSAFCDEKFYEQILERVKS